MVSGQPDVGGVTTQDCTPRLNTVKICRVNFEWVTATSPFEGWIDSCFAFLCLLSGVRFLELIVVLR